MNLAARTYSGSQLNACQAENYVARHLGATSVYVKLRVGYNSSLLICRFGHRSRRLLANEVKGYTAFLNDSSFVETWTPCHVPLSSLFQCESRYDTRQPCHQRQSSSKVLLSMPFLARWRCARGSSSALPSCCRSGVLTRGTGEVVHAHHHRWALIYSDVHY
jgi:hypothetical protein